MHACCLRQLYLRCAKQGFGAPEGLPQSPCVWRGLSQGGKDISSACMRMCHKKETLNKSHLPRSLDLKGRQGGHQAGAARSTTASSWTAWCSTTSARGAKSGNLDTFASCHAPTALHAHASGGDGPCQVFDHKARGARFGTLAHYVSCHAPSALHAHMAAERTAPARGSKRILHTPLPSP